jgi:methylenetetrahydrofolate--tRNA-(uracil-5-)-methyltransferase
MTIKDKISKYDSRISVVGGGLAGTECALQLANMGFHVNLYEMRSATTTPAHKTGLFAELVCSNSFGSLGEISATGQLKKEARLLNSNILKAADIAQVPAGQALGVDRTVFAQHLTDLVHSNSNIKVINRAVESLDEIPRPAVIASGPLTHEKLSQSMQAHFGGDFLYFFDAIAPIIDTDSINQEIVWKADRYDKGTPDYFNCPLNKEQYFTFVDRIKNATKTIPKDFEKTPFFEGCMPIETIVDRGIHTLRFGPMKPVGLINPKAGREPFAVVQLRQDNKEGTAYNMVGFQTRMTYGDQKEIFRTIPGLENAEFLKLGSMHRNLFINSPALLNKDLSSKKDPLLFFAGQITGVEGYFESTCIGLLVAYFLRNKILNLNLPMPPRESAFGSILEAITDPVRAKHFQPTNINFGLLPPIENPPRDKTEKKTLQITKANEAFQKWLENFDDKNNPLV